MGSSAPDQKVTTQKQQGTTSEATTGTTAQNYSGATTGATTGTQAGATLGTQQQLQTAQIPDWLKPFVMGAVGTAGSSLAGAGQAIGGLDLSSALNPLEATARGDFLYGGPGQQPFIDAAVRAASPGIFSAFGAAGRAGSGLEHAALNQAAVDAYARLYGQERSNQLAAAQAIPGISTLPITLQQQLAQLAGGLPGQFAPFLGQGITGQTTGANFGTTTGTTMGTTAGQQAGMTSGTSQGTTSGLSRTTEPIYQTPWWQTALGAGAALAGLPLGGGLLGNTLGGAALTGLGLYTPSK